MRWKFSWQEDGDSGIVEFLVALMWSGSIILFFVVLGLLMGSV